MSDELNAYDSDILYLESHGYIFTETQADEFSDIVTRNYNDGLDTDIARKLAIEELKLGKVK